MECPSFHVYTECGSVSLSFAVFNMPSAAHTVDQLFTSQAFGSCNFSSAREWANSFNTSFEATLTEPGYYYFACGLSTNCVQGQKLEVYVNPLPVMTPPPAQLPRPPSQAPMPRMPHPPQMAPYTSPHIIAPVGAPSMRPKLSPTPAPAGYPVHSPFAGPGALLCFSFLRSP